MNASERAQCPVCGKEQSIEDIVEHVNQCLNEFEVKPKDEPTEPVWTEEMTSFDYSEERRREEEENER